MKSIFDQLFWLWAPISFLPEWLRIFVVLFVVVQLLLPILLKLFPFFIHFLKKCLYIITYPIMVLISGIQSRLRESGSGSPPPWVDGIEGLFALCERFFNKMIQLFGKKKRSRRKWPFYAGTALAVLVTAAIINNPNEWYALKWKGAETWLTQKKLGLNRTAPVQTKVAAAQKEFILNRQYKDGGNLREAPTLAARRVYTIASGEVVQFMNEEQVDSKGIKWLKVQTTNGRIAGWVSANIVREK